MMNTCTYNKKEKVLQNFTKVVTFILFRPQNPSPHPMFFSSANHSHFSFSHARLYTMLNVVEHAVDEGELSRHVLHLNIQSQGTMKSVAPPSLTKKVN